jgi:hypothetical protein
MRQCPLVLKVGSTKMLLLWLSIFRARARKIDNHIINPTTFECSPYGLSAHFFEKKFNLQKMSIHTGQDAKNGPTLSSSLAQMKRS